MYERSVWIGFLAAMDDWFPQLQKGPLGAHGLRVVGVFGRKVDNGRNPSLVVLRE